MYKIWFERAAPGGDPPRFADIAQGIWPGDQAGADPFHGLERANAVMAGSKIYDAAAMDRAPRLLVIARMGIGYDTVDIAAATARAIAVVNTPEAPTIPTAETAVALMLNITRGIKRIEGHLQRAIEAGQRLSAWDSYSGIELNGKRLGLIGLGRIGSRVARAGLALGMEVAAYDPYISGHVAAQLGVERAESLDDLLGSADVVSLHLPLNAGTRKLMNAERFAQMKRGAIFINVSRGGHVDEAALAAALDSGHIFGAGLDVTDPEPPQAGNPLLNRENVIITPHIGGASDLSRGRLYDQALEQILQVLRGQRPPNLINPEAWDGVLSRRADWL